MTKGQCCERPIGAANLSFDGLAKIHHGPQTLNSPSLHVYACLFSPSLPFLSPFPCVLWTQACTVDGKHYCTARIGILFHLCPDSEVSSSPQTTVITSDLKLLSIEIVTNDFSSHACARQFQQATCTTPRRNSFSTFEASPPQSGSPQAITAPVVVRDANAL